MQNTTNLPNTDFARKYGLWRPLQSHKSGYTPIIDSFPQLNVPEHERLLNAALTAYQKKNLRLFTTADLQNLDCLPTRDLRRTSLQNDIIPLLRRERWEVAPPQPDHTRDHLYPLKNGNGMWVATNDAVWDVMVPSLVIASRMLSSLHVAPFDALLNGERRLIPQVRLIDSEDHNRDDLLSFHARSPQVFRPDLASGYQRDNIFDLLMNKYNYTIGFMIQTESPSGPEFDGCAAFALTGSNRHYMEIVEDPPITKKWRISTWIDTSYPEMLMREDLNSAERMMIQYVIAETICHEVMHAIGASYTTVLRPPDDNYAEFYFEDEAINELGYSYEHAVEGGQNDEFVAQLDGSGNLPLGNWFGRYWPTWYDVIHSEGPALVNPEPLRYNEFYPIPISFYEDLQQEDFWNVGVRKYGHRYFHYRALKEGCRVTYVPNALSQWEYSPGKRKRISGDDPFAITENRTIVSDGARTILQLLAENRQRGVRLSPDQRTAVQFGTSLMNSSTLQERFWNQSKQQTALVAILRASLNADSSSLNPAQQANFYASLSDKIHRAIENHGEMVATLIQAEHFAGIQYSNRRDVLLQWNRGTRVFLKQLVGTPLDEGVERQQLRLERVRMGLFDPDTWPDQTVPEFQEMISIGNIRQLLGTGDYQAVADICNQRLLNIAETSIFATCYADIVLFFLGLSNHEGWLDRRNRLEVAQARISSIDNWKPDHWKDWVDRAVADVKHGMGMHQPPQPQTP